MIPGEFGSKQPWYFPFLPSFWAGCCTEDEREGGAGARSRLNSVLEADHHDGDMQQMDASYGEPAIVVHNLRKVFWSAGVEKVLQA